MLRRLSDAERGRGRWVEGGDGELAFPGELVRFSIASTSRTDGDGDSSGGWRYCEVTKARRRRRKSEQRRSGREKVELHFRKRLLTGRAGFPQSSPNRLEIITTALPSLQ